MNIGNDKWTGMIEDRSGHGSADNNTRKKALSGLSERTHYRKYMNERIIENT